MFEHFIIMASSYKQGTRIALHYLLEADIDFKYCEQVIRNLDSEFGYGAPFSTHYLVTDGKTWETVVSYDPFFTEVTVKDSFDDFVKVMKQDYEIQGLDIAKYILSQTSCTHMKLEKLTYMCYADYLCKYDEKLFEDDIYAFRYGPAVDSVYDEYRNTKSDLLIEIDQIVVESRFSALPNGEQVLNVINDVLRKYGDCTAAELMRITHADESPWSQVDCRKPYQIIPDEVIKKYHSNEELYWMAKVGD